MVGKFLFATVGLGVLVGMATGFGCSVKTSSGGSGGTTAGVTVATVTSGTMCTDTMGTKHCKACIGGCGVPNQGTTDLAGNCQATSSFTKYQDYFDCACGSDGMTGAC